MDIQKKHYLRAFLSVATFIVMQLAASVVMYAALLLFSDDYRKAMVLVSQGKMSQTEVMNHIPVLAIILSVLLSGILTVIICKFAIKSIPWKETTSIKGMTMKTAVLGFLAAIAGIFATNILSEQFTLPDLLGEQMQAMAHNVLGIIAIAIVGPIVEELVFREALLGEMLRGKLNPWIAMVISALAFGIVHGNPIQIPFAFLMGMILAVVYYRTGNVVLTSLIHICNNSLAVIQMIILGDKADEFTLTEQMGGATRAWIVIVLGTILCLLALRTFWRSCPEKE